MFDNHLVLDLAGVVDLDPSAILHSRATEFHTVVGPEVLLKVLMACNSALTTTYGIALAASCLSFVGL